MAAPRELRTPSRWCAPSCVVAETSEVGGSRRSPRLDPQLEVGFGVADEVDVRNDDGVGMGEAGGELVEEEACSGVLVGLEDAEEAAAGAEVVVAYGAECGVDFGGVVTVVVDDGDARA